jgi:RNA polymerase sigma-70 factor (ECF subfamily)
MAMSLVRTTEPASLQESDELLARRLRDGDARAGETLAKRHAVALLRYLQRVLRSDQLAEELHQQTWLSVLEHLDRFDGSGGPGGFKAWLFRIATNKANDLWRSKGREKNAKEGLRLVTEGQGPDAAAAPETAEQVDRLRWAIDQLPEAQRQVLLLRYYSEMKFVEIAEMLGCPLNTALGRMHKAMTKLKELLS